MGTVLTLNRFIREGFLPSFGIILPAVVCAALGAAAGASLTLLFSDYFLKWVMLILLPVSAVYVLRTRPQGRERQAVLPERSTRRRVVLIALGMGLYCGFYGPASGTFLMLLLFSLAKMPITEANCTTKLINLTTNLAAIAVFSRHGSVLWGLGVTVGLFNMLGCYFGARYFVKKSYQGARYIIVLVLALCFGKILWDLT